MSDSFTQNYGFTQPDFAVSPWHTKVNTNFAKIDALLKVATLAPNLDGTWAQNTAYTANQYIYDAVGLRLYRCLISHTSTASGTFATDFAAHPTYWSLLDISTVWRGTWSAGVVYHVGDTAFINGSTYRAAIDHTSSVFATDLSNLKWQLYASVGSTGAGAGDVVGPASAVDSRIVLFDGITGKLIKDSGITLASYATLANPAFTGIPTAPTAGAGTNTDQVATTSFVQAAVTALINGAAVAYDTLGELATALVAKYDEVVIHALASKATVVDADEILIIDSAATFGGKKATLTNFWLNYLKIKADALYQVKDATLTSLAAVAGVAGDILYASGTDAWTRLAKGTNGQVLSLTSGIPSWTDSSSVTLLGTLTLNSGTSKVLSGLNLTNYKYLMITVAGWITSSSTTRLVNGATLSGSITTMDALIYIELDGGVVLASIGTGASGGNSTLTNASTSVTLSTGNTMTAGSAKIYGVK